MGGEPAGSRRARALLLELEAPRQRDLRGIVLSDRVTDLALAGKHRRFFEEYARFVRSRFGGLAGLETRNLGHLLRALHEWGIAVDVVVGPVNPDGVAMKPSRGEVLAELARATVPVLAKELRGGGYDAARRRRAIRAGARCLRLWSRTWWISKIWAPSSERSVRSME
jgi:hypothetical protein